MTNQSLTQRIGRTLLLSSLLASFLVPSAFAGGPRARSAQPMGKVSQKPQPVQKAVRAEKPEKVQKLQKAKTLLQRVRAQREEKASQSSSLLTATQSADQNPVVTSSGTSSSDSYDDSGSGSWQLLDDDQQNGITLDWSYNIHQEPVAGGSEGYVRAHADLDSVNEGSHRDALDGYLHAAYGYGGSNGDYYAYAELSLDVQIKGSISVSVGESFSLATGQPYELPIATQSYDLWNWSSSFTVWIVPVTVGFDLDFNTWAGVRSAMISISSGEHTYTGTPSLEASFSGTATAGVGGSLNSILTSIVGSTIADAVCSIGDAGAEAGVGFTFTPLASLRADLMSSSEEVHVNAYIYAGAEMRLFLYIEIFAELLGTINASWNEDLTIFEDTVAENTWALCYFQHSFDSNESDGLLGDINGDGGWNVLDIVTLSNAILSQTGHHYGWVADLNGDGGYNVLDIVTLLNCVLAQNCGG